MTTKSRQPDLRRGDAQTQVAMKSDDSLHELTCHLQRSVRYHRARERFFESWSNLFSFVSLISGSAVVVTVLSQAPQWASMTAGAIVAVAQALEMVGRVSAKARIHNGLAGEFSSLERSLARGELPTEDALREYRAEIVSIEAREPPVKRYLDLICHNQVARAQGSDDVEPLRWYQRWFAQYLDGDSAMENRAKH